MSFFQRPVSFSIGCSATACNITGMTLRGANSCNGNNTNARSIQRGCGTVNQRLYILASP